MKKAAIFDMDGTLVANSPVHIRAFEIFCARYGVTDWREKLANGFGMGNDDIMRLVMPEEVIREKGLAALADEKEAIYREIYAPDIRPVEGLKELLERLRAAGIPCAVGSSGCKANVDFVLDSCAIRPYFDAAISGDMVSRCKPDPEIYLTAAAALGVSPADCVIFEDARAGFEAARRAGAGRIVVLTTTLPREELERGPLADRQSVKLTASVAKGGTILSFEDDAYQILFNLVENGIKYNRENGSVHVRVRQEDDTVVIDVVDTGSGIPENALESIFNRFYRVDKARSRQAGGAGLGLSIVHEMVGRNFGTITVRSTVGEGSCFTVTFPSFGSGEEGDPDA